MDDFFMGFYVRSVILFCVYGNHNFNLLRSNHEIFLTRDTAPDYVSNSEMYKVWSSTGDELPKKNKDGNYRGIDINKTVFSHPCIREWNKLTGIKLRKGQMVELDLSELNIRIKK